MNINDEKLTPISFVLLCLSDAFVLCLLCLGLSAQIGQFSDEHDYFPHMYRSMLIEKNWTADSIVEDVANHVSNRNDDNMAKKLHPAVRELEDMFDEIRNDETLVARLKAFQRQNSDFHHGVYNATAEEQLVAAEAEILKLPKITEVAEKIFFLQGENYEEDIEKYKKLFAVQRIFIDLAFLLPVAVLFLLWNKRSFRKKSSLCVTVSSHYLLVTFIPIMFEFLRMLIEILPEELFKNFYDFLISLKLVGFWYYLAIFLFILVCFFLIWIFQTKVFTKEKSFVKRFMAKRCMNCNSPIDYSENFCPICGVSLKNQCPHCGMSTIRNLPYCSSCGKKTDADYEESPYLSLT